MAFSKAALLWGVFALLVVASLVIDLGVHKSSKELSNKKALAWAFIWIGLAVAFGFVVLPFISRAATFDFFTAYLLEKALSVDNLFVFIVLFNYFRIPRSQQRRVLFWGILGALAMRALFIFLGVALLTRFHALIYLFGLFLLYTSAKLLFAKGEQVEPGKSLAYRLVVRILPIRDRADERSFFVREDGRWMATRLFLVLVVVEATDVVFALDSIPAVLAITTDPFVIYTSNIFAILGLRALYFFLAGLMERLRYLNLGLSMVLAFIGVKMMTAKYVIIPPMLSLGVVGGLLACAVAASVVAELRERKRKR